MQFRDICAQSRKLYLNVLNFARFLHSQIFGGASPKILDQHYKIGPNTHHRIKFHAGQPTHLGNLALTKKLEIWGKAQRESARRRKSDWGKLGRGG